MNDDSTRHATLAYATRSKRTPRPGLTLLVILIAAIAIPIVLFVLGYIAGAMIPDQK